MVPKGWELWCEVERNQLRGEVEVKRANGADGHHGKGAGFTGTASSVGSGPVEDEEVARYHRMSSRFYMEKAKMTLIWTVDEEESGYGEKYLRILGPLRGRLANNCEGVKSGQVVEVNSGDEYVIGEDAFLTIQDVVAHIADKATLHEKK
jgi:hypothetical protein